RRTVRPDDIVHPNPNSDGPFSMQRDDPDAWSEEDGRPSKSERKREMQALQELGEAIVALSDGEFATIPLEGQLAEAIQLARRLPHGEGRRRQLQYVGKLMRKVDTAPLVAAYAELQNGRQRRNQAF